MDKKIVFIITLLAVITLIAMGIEMNQWNLVPSLLTTMRTVI